LEKDFSLCKKDLIDLICWAMGPRLKCHPNPQTEAEFQHNEQADMQARLRAMLFWSVDRELRAKSFLERDPVFGRHNRMTLEELARLAFGPKVEFPTEDQTSEEIDATLEKIIFQIHLKRNRAAKERLKYYHPQNLVPSEAPPNRR
jgi:hypothetical protein